MIQDRQRRECHSHLIDEKPRWQKPNVTRENKLAMNLRGERRDGGRSKGNIFSVVNARVFCSDPTVLQDLLS